MQTRWAMTSVFKAMFIEGAVLMSPHYSKDRTYRVGETIHCDSDDYVHDQADLSSPSWFTSVRYSQAKQGIYVLATYQVALRYAQTLRDKYFHQVTILECTVDPQDFLYHDTESTTATYKKVKFSKIIKTLETWSDEEDGNVALK
jgi:hypothetical protein